METQTRFLRKLNRKKLRSKEIIEEFVGVLSYKEIQDKIKDKNLEIKRTVEKVVSMSTIIGSHYNFKTVKDDPDDNKFLNCALEGKADFIVS